MVSPACLRRPTRDLVLHRLPCHGDRLTAAPDDSPPLRVGLLLNSTTVPAWVVRMVEQIESGGHARIALLVLRQPDGPAPAMPRPALPSRLAAALLRRINRWFTEHVPRLPDPFAPSPLDARLMHVPRLEVAPQTTRWSDRLTEPDLATIRGHELDVLVRIGFRILRGGVLQAARHGVWSFHHGDNEVNRGGPPGWWEVMEDWPVTGCTLQVLSEDLDNGLVLDRTWGATESASLADSNARNYWKALSMIPRQLARLHREGPEQFFARARAEQRQPRIYSRRLYRNATATEMLPLVWRRGLQRLHKIWLAITRYEQWILLVQPPQTVERPASSRTPLNLSLWRFQRLMPPDDRFWADPFLYTHGGRTYLYFEELPYHTDRGHISVGELTPDGRLENVRVALQQPYHLSYPFVFEHGGEHYLLPESRAAGRLTLYRSIGMPERWEPLMDLMTDVEAVDATLLHHRGRWWLFVNLVQNPGASSNDELFIFHAEDFRTTHWTPHPMNPVVSDARRARGAGRIVEHDGVLYRPAQDCSHAYGWGFRLMRIDRLDTESYAETDVAQAEPGWSEDVVATHTLASGGGFTVIDACLRRRGSWTSLRRQLNRWRGRP